MPSSCLLLVATMPNALLSASEGLSANCAGRCYLRSSSSHFFVCHDFQVRHHRVELGDVLGFPLPCIWERGTSVSLLLARKSIGRWILFFEPTICFWGRGTNATVLFSGSPACRTWALTSCVNLGGKSIAGPLQSLDGPRIKDLPQWSAGSFLFQTWKRSCTSVN